MAAASKPPAILFSLRVINYKRSKRLNSHISVSEQFLISPSYKYSIQTKSYLCYYWLKSPPIMSVNQQLHTSAVLNICTGAGSVDTLLSLSDQVPLIGSNAPRQPVWSEAKYCMPPLGLSSLSSASSSLTTFQLFS